MVTRTINQLHFEDLDPIRFEELILAMVYRMRRWDKLDHFGKKGTPCNKIQNIQFVPVKAQEITNT